MAQENKGVSESKLNPTEFLLEAIHENDFEKAKFAIKHKAKVKNDFFRMAVLNYLEKPSVYDHRILGLLIENGADINDSWFGLTPFHFVANSYSGSKELDLITEFFLRYGAKYDIVADEGTWSYGEPRIAGKTVKELFSYYEPFQKTFEEMIKIVAAEPSKKVSWPPVAVKSEEPIRLGATSLHVTRRQEGVGRSGNVISIYVSSSGLGNDARTKTIRSFYHLKSEKSFVKDKYAVEEVNREYRFWITMKDNEYNKKIFAKHTEELFERAYPDYRKASGLKIFFDTQEDWKRELAKFGIHIQTVKEKRLVQDAELSLILAGRVAVEKDWDDVVNKQGMALLIPDILEMANENQHQHQNQNPFLSGKDKLRAIVEREYVSDFFKPPADVPKKEDSKQNAAASSSSATTSSSRVKPKEGPVAKESDCSIM